MREVGVIILYMAQSVLMTLLMQELSGVLVETEKNCKRQARIAN